MIEVDEADLTAFFSVVPEPQADEEREFFAAPLFVKVADGMQLTVSISTHFNELRLELDTGSQTDHVLSYVLSDLVSVRIEPERNGRGWLVAKSRSGGEVAISVDPTITVDIKGSNAPA